ncbi:MAG: hypothetical protein Q4C91_09435 [Eubacteriales bacterium]|nr:hypothetical protein [Eubacteriales bacterium]
MKKNKSFIIVLMLILIFSNILTVSAANNDDEVIEEKILLNSHIEELEGGDEALIEDYIVLEVEPNGLITHRKTLTRSWTIYSIQSNGNKKYHIKFELEGRFKYTGSYSECETVYSKIIPYSNKYRGKASKSMYDDTATLYCTAINNQTGKSTYKTIKITVDKNGNVTYS